MDMQVKSNRIDLEKIEKFVGSAHGDFETVIKMLKETPELVNCSWDWGGGDCETALGAAAHMGRKDIAEFLISNGAKIDIFSAAMLGKIDVVRSIITDFPHMKDIKGPHGIPLILHAKAGGADSQSIVDLLSE